MSISISASTNPPKIEDLPNYIKKLDKTNVDYIHCDVMDGKFVENVTFNHKMLKTINTLTTKKLDVHLMVTNPSGKIKKYIKNGADIVTIHYEAYKNKKKLLKDLLNIRKFGAFAGLSFNPSTNVTEILPFLYFCDMLLVMSVVPGKSGQTFISETFDRLKQITTFLKSQEIEVIIEVDGGVNNQNLPKLKQLGVNSVVMGNFLYSSSNLSKTINEVKTL